MRDKDFAAYYMDMVHEYSANHYGRLPVVMERSQGCQLWDIKGQEYLDMFADYSVANFGHVHPLLLAVHTEQAAKFPISSGIVYNSVYANFCQDLAKFSGIPKAKVLAMNGGAEAVEKAIKIARKWGYEKKGVKNNKAEIIVTDTNFHGRTLGVLSASKVFEYKYGFGPFLEGFQWVPFGSIKALERTVNEYTAAVLMEPIQGEGGFIFPPDGYLKQVAELCRERKILFVLDVIPTALGRTGENFPHEHDGFMPDMLILGKALGGGLATLSAVVTRAEVMDVLRPGDDGSTFGGNPLACRVGSAVIGLMRDDWAGLARSRGEYFLEKLRTMKSPLITEVRGRGLMIGVELIQKKGIARKVCEGLLKERVLTTGARREVVRFTPPLMVTEKEIDFAINAFGRVLDDISKKGVSNAV